MIDDDDMIYTSKSGTTNLLALYWGQQPTKFSLSPLHTFNSFTLFININICAERSYGSDRIKAFHFPQAQPRKT